MAMIKVEYDTVSKKMNCHMDGQMLENVSGVRLGLAYSESEESKYYCEVTQMKMNKDDKTITYVQTTAELAEKSEDKAKIDESLNNAISNFLRD